MKTSSLVLAAILALLVLGPTAGAAPYKAPAVTTSPAGAFTIEGKVLQLSKGRFELTVTRADKGSGFKLGQKIWIQETNKTKMLQASKAVSAKALKVGQRVEVSGDIMRAGKMPTYNALSVQIVRSR